ncbi:MAG: hypothetical protein ACE5OY_02420 [Candidatus Bathyarchaeia archaeon]
MPEREHKKEPNKRGERRLRLDWRDYIAFMIAALQTTLLPVVLLLGVITVMVILFTLLFVR